MKVWYQGTKPRTAGLRLLPGWNELPVATAILVIERGIALQEQPGATEESSEADEELKPSRNRKKARGRRRVE